MNGRTERTRYLSVAVCCVNRGKVKLDALLSEGHTRAWQCKDVPLICQRLHVDLLVQRVSRGIVCDTMNGGYWVIHPHFRGKVV